MPFNPGNTDRSGEFIAGGIMEAFQNISRGIDDHRRKRKEEESSAAAVAWMKKFGDKYGLNTADDDELKSFVKAAGGGPQALQVVNALAQNERAQKAAAQQEQLVAAQMAEMERRKAVELRSSGAMRAAVGGMPDTSELGAMIAGGGTFQSTAPKQSGSPEEMVLRALRTGAETGSPKEFAATMASLEAMRRGREQFKPEMVDLGNGVSGMTTSRSSAVPIAKGKPEAAKPMSPAGRLLADADALEAAGQKDDAALLRKLARKPADEKAMNLMDFLISGGRAEDYRTYVENLRDGHGTKGGEETAAPVTVTDEEQFKKLKPGTRFSWNGKVGTKK